MVIDVLLPFMPNFYPKMHRFSYQSPCLNFIGTTQILITSVSVFMDAHAATSPSFLSSIAWLLHWCWVLSIFFLTWSVVECFPLHTLQNLFFLQFFALWSFLISWKQPWHNFFLNISLLLSSNDCCR